MKGFKDSIYDVAWHLSHKMMISLCLYLNLKITPLFLTQDLSVHNRKFKWLNQHKYDKKKKNIQKNAAPTTFSFST